MGAERVAFNPTDEQKLAIYEKGSIIVSAAAGSGKTAVLVERVADLLLGEGPHIDADKLLIVTFTKTAAAELRARIEKKMNEEFSKHSDNPEYQRQQLLLSAAKICTIDSFCIDFLKENYDNKKIAIVAHRAPQLALDVIVKGMSWEDAIKNDWRNTKNWQPGWIYIIE